MKRVHPLGSTSLFHSKLPGRLWYFMSFWPDGGARRKVNSKFHKNLATSRLPTICFEVCFPLRALRVEPQPDCMRTYVCCSSPPPRIHGGTSRWWWHLPGRLHCEEIEPALSRHHPLLHDVCDGQSGRHLYLSHPLPQRAHGRCHSIIPVRSDGETPTEPVQRPVWQAKPAAPWKQVGNVYVGA